MRSMRGANLVGLTLPILLFCVHAANAQDTATEVGTDIGTLYRDEAAPHAGGGNIGFHPCPSGAGRSDDRTEHRISRQRVGARRGRAWSQLNCCTSTKYPGTIDYVELLEPNDASPLPDLQ